MKSVLATFRRSPGLIVAAIRAATLRQAVVAFLVAAVMLVLVGLATVLIPNSLFSREIPPTAWNYPVWILTAVLAGLLAATYVTDKDAPAVEQTDREGRWGILGAGLTWFAVGCPVCNKIALLALGYSGALAWFAPLQPVLAVAALLLLWFALARRLEGAQMCALPPVPAGAAG
ncbi:hypothetical protein [Gordonia alkaliphila]|uniref:Integral membrane protein n=1 Tax=Gordonia alkaliphila TaxID=1053547 RepID=A0ABP8Z0H5_9ACTN